ncbi:hypothetical protein BKI52_02615 [marine bacterium AO1-C]|nr:hypothetical protein BKI52_02615 [marine bacterium AO1-C]
MKLIKPSSGQITSKYGWRRDHFHPGIDLTAGTGSQVIAAASGTIIQVGKGCQAGNMRCQKGLGNYVAIDHHNGYYTAYFHLTTLNVKQGQKVKVGQVLGSEGNTGYSFGSHLHFELRTNLNLAKEKGSIDPYAYLFEDKELPNPKQSYWLEILAVVLLVGLVYLAYRRGYVRGVLRYVKH